MSIAEHAAFEPLIALQDAVSRCLHLPEQRSTQDTLQAAIGLIRLSGSVRLRALNDAAPINQLPDNLLSRIFSYATDEDRTSAIYVCQRWRSTFAEGARRPRDIEFSFTNGTGLGAAAVSLGCLPGSPVLLNLLVCSECDTLGDLIPRHMAHIRQLYIQVMPSFVTFDRHQLFRPLLRALEVPAPALEEFDIWSIQRSWSAGNDQYLSEDLFQASAPRLRSFRLHGVALHDRVYPALTGIQRLSLSQFSVDLAHILAFYPRLVQLHIDVVELVSSAESLSHSLRILHIHGPPQAAEIVCTQLRPAYQSLSVWLEAQGDGQLAYILAQMRRQGALRVQIIFDAIRAQTACVVTCSGGWTWVVDFLPSASPLAACGADVVSSVAELRMHELAWPGLPSDVPPARHLTHLELILYEWTQDPGTVAGIFFGDVDDSHCMLQCPALEQLSFFSRSGSPLVVDVFDVLSLISTRLRFAPAPLGCLRLRNVSLHDPTWGRGLQALTARVQQIEYCTVREPDIPYIHEKSGFMSWIYTMMGSEEL